ncbi:hypothetical protein [Cupriavidus sp. DL-D2]|uniref:hypothetical protein n=1 Tax=Cupriavidus sp. DL-D2 TaxID=3144974 RepID=UPI003213CE66
MLTFLFFAAGLGLLLICAWALFRKRVRSSAVILGFCAGLIVTAVGGGLIASSLSGDNGVEAARRAEKAAQLAADEAACKENPNCWGARFIEQASVPCSQAIERYSKFSFRWKDTPTETRFPRAAWEDEPAGRIAFIGDRIQFQNGFGAYQDMKYICSYDIQGDRVISARVYEGRL